MIATHETLLLQTTSAAADALSPGAVQRTLWSSLRLSADALGMMHPLGRGQIGVEVALPHALSLMTPMTLTSVDETGAATLFRLRRQSDPLEGRETQLRIHWNGPSPTPGVVVRALVKATDERFDSKDLASVFVGADWMSAEVSEGLRARLKLPLTVTVDDCTLTLTEDSSS